MNKSANRAERHDIQIIAELNSTPDTGKESKPFLCNTLNMSLTGALIETSQNMQLGSLLNYSFRLPGAGNQLKVLAEIVRCEPEAATKAKKEAANKHSNHRKPLGMYGIQFLEIKKSDMAAIKTFLLN